MTADPGLSYNRIDVAVTLERATSWTPGAPHISFQNRARPTAEPELLESPRRRRDGRDAERPAPPRRARRRRHSTSWLQRNALSVAAFSVLVALLGSGFGLLQMITRPEPSPQGASASQVDQSHSSSAPAVMNAASLGPNLQINPASVLVGPALETRRSIQSNVKVLEPNYTIAAGDTLVQIAQRFNTTVDRVQAFNNLADPRALRIGARLVVPPPL